MQNEKSKISELMGISMEKIREMGDVRTVIGDPIQAGDTTIIPVSKVSYGFASGGSDLPAKENPKELFGGGAGAGVCRHHPQCVPRGQRDLRGQQLFR